MLLPDVSSIAPYPPSNYGFDANGTLGRFDPIYIFANLYGTSARSCPGESRLLSVGHPRHSAQRAFGRGTLGHSSWRSTRWSLLRSSSRVFVFAGMWVWDLLRKQPTVMWARFVKMFAALLAIWIYGHVNTAFINTMNSVTDETAASLGNVVLSLTHQGDTVSSASVTLEQQIWSSLIQMPWEQGEMGGTWPFSFATCRSVEACGTSGQVDGARYRQR